VRRFATLALSLPLMFGPAASSRLFAQDEKKTETKPAEKPADKPADKPAEAKPADEPKKGATNDAPKDAPPKSAAKAEPAKDQDKSAAEVKPAAPAAPVLKPIPPEVQAKIDIARKAIAEAVAAAEAAGLVQTSIEPPPIMDIILTGQANDVAALKLVTKDDPEAGVSPEVFGAWFTNQGKMEGITAEKNVRIVPPSKGLAEMYSARATIFAPLLAEARKNAKPPAKPPEEKKEAAPKPAEAKKDDKPAEKPAEAKKDDKPAEKPAEAKKDDKPAEKPADAPKPEEPKGDKPADTPKGDPKGR
jgi:hypothetical protein